MNIHQVDFREVEWSTGVFFRCSVHIKVIDKYLIIQESTLLCIVLKVVVGITLAVTGYKEDLALIRYCRVDRIGLRETVDLGVGDV